MARRNDGGTEKDDRVTIKIEKELWRVLTRQISEHPEWGVKSVSEFIRRAISHELEAKSGAAERKVLEIQLRPASSREDSHDRGPGEARD